MPDQAVDPVKITVQLRAHYTAKKHLTLLIPQEYKEIPIEQLYTRLAIIGEHEKKEKKKETGEAHLGQDALGYGITPTHESIFEPKEPVELEKLFNHENLKGKPQKRILIQGSAGIGKSTLCHHISFRWAKGDLFQEFEFLFWLPLRNLNKDHYGLECSLEAYLAKECLLSPEYVRSFLSQVHLREKTLILLDGYDELSPDAVNPRGALNRILTELKGFPNVIITTRPQYVDFNPDYNFEILGFDAKGAQEYISQFFLEGQKTQTQQQKDHAKELRTKLKNPLARSLARIPINLEIFCSLVAAGEPLFASSEASSITSLYIRLTDWLFKRFRIDRSQELNDPNKVIEESDARHATDVDPLAQALEEIAWKAMEQNTLYIPEPQITQILRSIERKYSIRDATRVGPLRIENKEGVFIHLTFQEFFAAAYLARIYTTDREEAKRCVQRIKFEPRYVLVLRMTAGYLSYLANDSEKGQQTLQLFFDDLFAEPYDLAISYSLRVQANCFEECEKPEIISHYNSFIERTVNFLNVCPNHRLIINLLTGSSKLISHKEVAPIFRDQIRNSKTQLKILYILINLARNGQALPPEAFRALVGCLSNPQADSDAKSMAVEALGEVAQSGHASAHEAFQVLVGCLSDPQADKRVKSKAAGALGAVVRSGHALPPEAFQALVGCLSDPQAGSLAIYTAADALGAVVRSGYASAPKAFQALVNCLSDPQADSYAKDSAALVLIEVAQRGHASTPETFQALVSCLSDPRVDSDAKSMAAEVLVAMVKSGHALSTEAFQALVSCLSDPRVDSDAKSMAAEALVAVVESGHALFTEAFQALVSCLSDPQADSDTKSIAAKALGEVVKSGHALSTEAFAVLVGCLSDPQADWRVKSMVAGVLSEVVESGHASAPDPQADWRVKSMVAGVLSEVVESGHALSTEAFQALVSCLSDPRVDSDAKSMAAEALVAVVESGHALFTEAFQALVSCLSDPQADSDTKSIAAKALGEVVKSGHALSTEAFAVLVGCLSDPQADWRVKSMVAGVLSEVVESGHALPSEALAALVGLLSDPRTDQRAKSSAILVEVAKSGHALPSEVLAALVGLLSDPRADQRATSSAILIEVAKSGHTLPFEMVQELIQIFGKADYRVQVSILDLLDKINQHQNYQWSDTKYALLKQLFFITGRALFYREEKFYTTSKHNKVSINEEVKVLLEQCTNPEELYQKLINKDSTSVLEPV